MLAQAAKNAGLLPLVIDLFADSDTRTYAVDFKQIPDLSIASLTSALDHFVQHYSVTQVVYGSGFEQHSDSLSYIASRFTLLGNSAVTFNKLQDKAYFFATLKQLNIPTPETSFVMPTDTQDWLIKPMRGQGGVGIQHFRSTNLLCTSSSYWQRYQAGSQYSVLFLADGQHWQLIGFNTQWTTRLSDEEEFIFAGIINHCELAATHKAQITHWLTKLVSAFELKGLNSLDFIHADGNSVVLEINPRPPASMQLYDADLLRRHINADITLNEPLPPMFGYTGYQIIYADQTVRIPEGYSWQNGTMDLPIAGAMCKTGQPICSIIAHQNQAHAVLNELNIKQHTIKKGLYSHGTHSQR